MNILKFHDFGDVKGYEFGYKSKNSPFMSVYVYLLDGLMIDTGQTHMENAVIDIIQDYELKLKWIILTHHHEDHSGNASILKHNYGVEVMGHPLTAYMMQNIKPILLYRQNIWG